MNFKFIKSAIGRKYVISDKSCIIRFFPSKQSVKLFWNIEDLFFEEN